MVDLPPEEPAEGLGKVKVGVLAREPDEIGEWLADSSAFDAAGADALWVDPGPEPQWDFLALTAALAVVTFRSRLVVSLPDSSVSGPALADTLRTIGRLSHGRLTLLVDPGRDAALPALGVGVFRRVPGEPGVFEGPEEGEAAERWLSAPAPQGRASWRTACADAAERGAQGLVVPADQLLLDILRNPADPGGRRDLHLAQG